MKTRIFILFLCLFAGYSLQAKETPVEPGSFSSAYSSASDGDVLLLSAGVYGSSIAFPDKKAVTLKAAEGESPVFTGAITGSGSISGGSLIFDGVEIKRGDNYVFDAKVVGDIKLIAFRNLTIHDVGRCLIRTDNTGNTIDKIEFENCVIKDCGKNGWNFIYTKHTVKSVSVKNSTLYNYLKGESFFFANATDESNVFEFVFENNTVYKWGLDSGRAFANTGNSYSPGSTYTFRNNIVNEPGAAGQLPKMVNIGHGIVVAENNLIVNYGGYSGGTQDIKDLTLEGLGMESIGFPDPDNGDFTILSTSPLATAGVDGKPLGDPTWIRVLINPVNLTTAVYPEGAGTVIPVSSAYEKDDWSMVTATHKYGYRFKEWQKDGKSVSTENPYAFQIEEDTELTAVFDVVDTYTLTINKDGEGAEWGRVVLNPQPVSGVYEKNELVTVTIVPNSVSSFLYWDDQTNNMSRQILMDGDKNLTATFDWMPFIVAWNFEPMEPRTSRPGDFYSRSDNMGVMNFFNGDGTSTSWGWNTKTFEGVTYSAARRYTSYADMNNPRYFQAEFSAKGFEQTTYSNIQIKSYIAADNACVHKIQKIQYATSESGEFKDLASVDLTDSYNKRWVELSATLPELSEDEKETIYVRWVADTSSGFLGSPSGSDTEGFFLANVAVYADVQDGIDEIPPVLLSSIPADASSNASANGSVVLTFDERVKAGANDGKIEFNGELLTPVFGNKTVSYPYKKLAYGTQYMFTVPDGVITDMSGNAYEGKTLTFSTMNRPQPIPKLFDAVVDINGTGDYTNIQAAIDNAPINRSVPWLIFIKNGRYEEYVRIPADKPFIHLIGQDKENVVVTFKINCSDPDNPKDAGREYSKVKFGLADCATVVVESSDFYAENISFENSWGVDAQSGPQALAIKTNNDRFAFYNCKFRSFQDTWMTSSKGINDRTFAYNCWIEGAVDYFYGAGDAFVDECTLYNVRSGSVIVAPSHQAGTLWGYVFNNCIVDGNAASNDGKNKLGRPWHNEPVAVFLNTTMKVLPHPEGWTDMGPAPKLFAEYNSMDINGNPIDLRLRRTWFKQSDSEGGQIIIGLKSVLTQEEASKYTYENVISGLDGWNPRAFYEAVSEPEEVTLSDGNKLTWKSTEYAICYVIYKDGKVLGFTTETTYTDTSSGQRATAEYKVCAVNEFGSLSEFSEKAADGGDSIETEESAGNKPGIEKRGEELIINNIEEGTIVNLFAVDGRLVKQVKSDTDMLSIPVSSLKGIYLVKINNSTFKVIF